MRRELSLPIIADQRDKLLYRPRHFPINDVYGLTSIPVLHSLISSINRIGLLLLAAQRSVRIVS